MKIKSLIQNGPRLEVAEVELEFIPGIPQIHFLGLPDRIIKESFYRIKSALKSSGYKFPLTSQMIVNIKPNHLRKSSRGVELAVALGILLKTGQIDEHKIDSNWVIYGELGLDGSVYEPSDLQQNLFYLEDISILTGIGKTSCFQIENLQSLEINYSKQKKVFKRPELGTEKSYTQDEAEFLFLAATSGLHSLLAGDSGAGKSTLAQALNSFLPEPSEHEHVRIENFWRPMVAPHQSITPAAFLGGGAGLYEGEIERVQGGVLLLDELLEFDPEILESLRGPMTGDTLRISRGAHFREVAAHFQVVATTNLCPCGKWTPLKSSVGCRFTRTKCTRYLERFSGPILDRFALLLFSVYKDKRSVQGREITQRINRYFTTHKTYEQQLPKATIPSAFEAYYAHLTTRRKNYLTQVAGVYALDRIAANAQVSSDELSFKIDLEDYNKAERWVIRPFELLEKGMS
jgi:magnesium chelatase family protein